MDITLHKSTLRDARKGVKSVKPSSTAVLQYIAVVDSAVSEVHCTCTLQWLDSAVSAGGGKEAIKASSVGDPSQAAQARSATPV